MANFNTHVTYAAAASGLLSILCLQVGLVTPKEAVLLALTGTIGGILPDVDLQRSYPSQLLFGMFGLIAAVAVVYLYENTFSIIELWFVGAGSFIFIRYPVRSLFHQFATHRGSIHSLTVAFMAMFMTVFFAHDLFNLSALVSWFFGLFMIFGFILHLLLDELYSVDFTNKRIKRSFGTAMKIIDTRKPIKACALIGATVGSWAITPPANAFWDTLTSTATYSIIAQRLYPSYLADALIGFYNLVTGAFT